MSDFQSRLAIELLEELAGVITGDVPALNQQAAVQEAINRLRAYLLDGRINELPCRRKSRELWAFVWAELEKLNRLNEGAQSSGRSRVAQNLHCLVGWLCESEGLRHAGWEDDLFHRAYKVVQSESGASELDFLTDVLSAERQGWKRADYLTTVAARTVAPIPTAFDGKNESDSFKLNPQVVKEAIDEWLALAPQYIEGVRRVAVGDDTHDKFYIVSPPQRLRELTETLLDMCGAACPIVDVSPLADFLPSTTFLDMERPARAFEGARALLTQLAFAVAGPRRAVPFGDKQESVPFVMTQLQRAIWIALNGRALKGDALAEEVSGGDKRRLYKRGGIKELTASERVLNKPTVGYYRPDAPPSDFTIG
ncbi:MAG: hypothetical protein K8T25_07415 [Planctomycetia bacterium]|nr:hypothetical protein [Planctomycetia bacterium]